MTQEANPEPRDPEFHIQIDRRQYTVDHPEMTGLELRHVPIPPIPEDRDLWEVIPGDDDRLIENDTVVTMRDGLRFFSAPKHINPGASTRTRSRHDAARV